MLAALGIAVAVIAVIALRHPNGHATAAGTATRTVVHTLTATPTARSSSHAPATRASTSHATTSAASSSSGAAERLPLIVLNNTTISGLAEQAAQTFENGGWTVTSYANYQNNIASTCAYYDPSVSGAHRAALALQSQFPAIKRVKPKFEPLPDGPIIVILTPDFAPSQG